MLVKIKCRDPEVSPELIASLSIEINHIDTFINQLITNGIVWENTNDIKFKFSDIYFSYNSYSEKHEEQFYLTVMVEEVFR